jgi:hypothetical protein
MEVFNVEIRKDDGQLKDRFLEVRKEIYNRYTDKEQPEPCQQVSSVVLKPSMSQREQGGEFIEIETDITTPGACKQTHRTVTDRLIKKPSHEDFVSVWSEVVIKLAKVFDV